MLDHTYALFSLSDEKLSNSLEQGHLKKSYYSSRKALINALLKLDHNINWPNLEQIQIENHLHLKGHQSVLVSLSHTKNFVSIASVAHHEEGQVSIGVDLEESSRPIKKSAAHYFLNKEDEQKSLLQLWCLKEASFKALFSYCPTFQKRPLLLKDIWIRESLFGLLGDKTPLGTCEIDLKEFNSKEYFLAFAKLAKKL